MLKHLRKFQQEIWRHESAKTVGGFIKGSNDENYNFLDLNYNLLKTDM